MSKSSNATQIVLADRVQRSILMIRGQRVILDLELAGLYAVSTKVLNQAVRRNPQRFPDDFMFRLTRSERDEVVTNCDHLQRLKFSRTFPFAFSEQGVAMLSSVLKSERAVEVNVQIMRTFVRLRQLLATNAGLAKKLTELELKYDHHFKVVFDAIRELMAEPSGRRKPPIGYHTEIRKAPGRKGPAAIERLGPHMNERKNHKRKPTARRAASLPAEVKVVPAPKSAWMRKLMSGPDITTSGGARTIHGATVRR